MVKIKSVEDVKDELACESEKPTKTQELCEIVDIQCLDPQIQAKRDGRKRGECKTDELYNCPCCEHTSNKLYNFKRHLMTRHASYAKQTYVMINPRGGRGPNKIKAFDEGCEQKHGTDEKSGCSGENSVRKKSDFTECYLCPTCGSTYNSSHALRNHRKTHLTEKKHQCHICGFSTKHRESLTAHLKTHTDCKRFKCPSCPYTCHKLYGYKRHLRRHTGDKKFKCDLCSYSSVESTRLKVHVMMVHTGEKPFGCSHCPYGSAVRGNVTTHIKSQHPTAMVIKCDAQINIEDIIESVTTSDSQTNVDHVATVNLRKVIQWHNPLENAPPINSSENATANMNLTEKAAATPYTNPTENATPIINSTEHATSNINSTENVIKQTDATNHSRYSDEVDTHVVTHPPEVTDHLSTETMKNVNLSCDNNEIPIKNELNDSDNGDTSHEPVYHNTDPNVIKSEIYDVLIPDKHSPRDSPIGSDDISITTNLIDSDDGDQAVEEESDNETIIPDYSELSEVKSGKPTLKQKRKNIEKRRKSGLKPKRVSTAQKSINTFRCPVCGYSCHTKAGLMRHKEKHNSTKPYLCDLCGFASAWQRSMDDHRKTHTNIKPFKCPDCPYTTQRSSNLIRHRKTHSGERNHICPLCGYRAVEAYKLTYHIRRHNNEKPYKCPLCPYACVTSGELGAHKRSKHTFHSEMPVKPPRSACLQCERTFAYKQDLIKHVDRVHSPDLVPTTYKMPLSHKCTKCELWYRYKGDLAKHMKKKHLTAM